MTAQVELRLQTETAQTRKCGDCQLCCRLLPVLALGKEGGTRCKHQKFGVGCAVYNQTPTVIAALSTLGVPYRAGTMPRECMIWNCRWLVSNDTADQSRPDRCYYVIDIMPDFVTAIEDGGVEHHIEVVQIWVDPKHRDAYKNPDLRAYIIRRAEEGIAALIRYSPTDGFVLIAPPLNTEGEWIENRGPSLGRTHSMAEVVKALS